jgi:hypothetical protein
MPLNDSFNQRIDRCVIGKIASTGFGDTTAAANFRRKCFNCIL